MTATGKHFYTYSILCIIFCIVGCSRASSKPKPLVPPAQIEIRGGPRFQRQTQQACVLLENKAAQSWKQVRTYIYVIEQGSHSAMWAYERPPRVEINNVTAFHSLTWYAGVLAHESMHAALYNGAMPNIPVILWNGQHAEQVCIAYQISVMRQLNAPYHEIQYLQSLDGTHCDRDGDGDCDWADYAQRQW